MAAQYMTDGQFEEYCRRQAAEMVTIIESTVPRMLALDPVLGPFRRYIELLFPPIPSTGARYSPNILERIDRLETEVREWRGHDNPRARITRALEYLRDPEHLDSNAGTMVDHEAVRAILED